MIGFSTVARGASVALAAVALVLLARTSVAPDKDVRQTFANYKRAVLANDGSAAAEMLSADTIAWYAEVQRTALHASHDELEHLPAIRKLQVLAFRQRMPAPELRDLSARQLVAYSVSHGWVGKKAMASSALGAVAVAGEVATAEPIYQGKPSGQQYRFVREDGHWRFDQRPLLDASNVDLTKLAAQGGTSEDQLILKLLESASGKAIDPAIWEPPFPEAR